MKTETRSYRAVAIQAGLVAAVGAGLIHAIGLLLDVSMVADGPTGVAEIPLLLSVAQAFGITLIGAGVAFLIARRSDDAARIYMWIAVVLFVLMTGNAFVAADGVATAIVLTLMHIAVLVPTLYWVVPALQRK